MADVEVNEVTVGTTATKLNTSTGVPGHNITFTSHATTAIEVGGSGVTFGTGYPLKVDTEYVYDTTEGDLYAVVASGTVAVKVLSTGT